MAIENQREIRGFLIAVKGSEVKRINASTYRVRSQSDPNKWYLVVKNEFNEWVCECPDFYYRRVVCKHIYAVRFSLRLRQTVSEESFATEGVKLTDEPVCPSCGNMEVVKDGKRKNKRRVVQRFLCKACGYRFVNDLGFSKVKATPQAIMININGDLKWLWNLMDNDTRFLLACQVHKHREVKDVREVFREAKERAKTMPLAVVHDGLRSYDKAFNKEFFTLANPRVQNIRCVGDKARFNQLIERLQGTFGERDKIMRAFDNDDSAKEFAEAFKIWYNFLRPHMGLNGLTPAEKAGIQLGLGENRWETLIKQAYISRKLTNNHEKP